MKNGSEKKEALSKKQHLAAAVILLFAMLMLLFSGCGTKTQDAGTSAAASAAPSEEVQVSAAAAPAETSAENGWSGLSFTTKDLDGNTVTAEELFSSHRITMVNCWTTWCPYCIEEFPELEKLSGVLSEKDCALVGLCLDAQAPVSRTADEARELLKQTGVTYPNLVSFREAEAMFPSQAVPTTYFVDSEGRIVGEPVVGALIDAYLPAVEKLLKQ